MIRYWILFKMRLIDLLINFNKNIYNIYIYLIYVLENILDYIFIYSNELIIVMGFFVFSFDISNLMKDSILKDKTNILEDIQKTKVEIIESSKTTTISDIKNQNNTQQIFKLLNYIYQYNHVTTWIDDFECNNQTKGITISFNIFSTDIDGVEEYIEYLIQDIPENYDLNSYNIETKEQTIIQKYNTHDNNFKNFIKQYITKIKKGEVMNIKNPIFDPLLIKNLYTSKIKITEIEK